MIRGPMGSIYVVERPPMIVKAQLQRILGPASQHDFPVMYPWQLFVLHFDQTGLLVNQPRAFWTDRPLDTVNHQLLRVATPNMNPEEVRFSGTGCLGGSWTRPPSGTSPAEVAQLCIDFLHNSAYNSDLSQGIMNGLTPPEIAAIPIPDNYMGLSGDAYLSNVVKHFTKWKIWTEQAVNPKIEVCELGWAPSLNLKQLLDYLEPMIQ